MTDIEALRTRMREAAEKAKAAEDAFGVENAKPGHDLHLPSDEWLEAYVAWGGASGSLHEVCTPEAILALDAYTTRLREDLDRVTRERDDAKIVRANYEDLKRAYGTLQAMHRERQDWAAKQTARAEAAEAALAKMTEEVAKLPRVTALLRHLVQVFDAGGESCGRSMRAGFAEEAFDILHRDDPAYLIEYDRCQYDPIEYLMERRRAEAKALTEEPTNAE